MCWEEKGRDVDSYSFYQSPRTPSVTSPSFFSEPYTDPSVSTSRKIHESTIIKLVETLGGTVRSPTLVCVWVKLSSGTHCPVVTHTGKGVVERVLFSFGRVKTQSFRMYVLINFNIKITSRE